MVTTFTYKPSLVRIDARNFELSWYTHAHTHTPHWCRNQFAIWPGLLCGFSQMAPCSVRVPWEHTHTQTGPITIHCAAASAQCNKNKKRKNIKINTHRNISIRRDNTTVATHNRNTQSAKKKPKNRKHEPHYSRIIL